MCQGMVAFCFNIYLFVYLFVYNLGHLGSSEIELKLSEQAPLHSKLPYLLEPRF